MYRANTVDVVMTLVCVGAGAVSVGAAIVSALSQVPWL